MVSEQVNFCSNTVRTKEHRRATIQLTDGLLSSQQVSQLLFKYHVSKLRGGGPNFWQYANIVIEWSLPYIRAYQKSKVSLKYFGTRIFSWVCIYINGKFWFWRFFFIFSWVKMPPYGYNEKNIRSLISWSIYPLND